MAMHLMTKIALGAAALSALAMGAVAPAEAGVVVGVGVGVPGVWYGPPGPCAAYRYYYGAPWANCGWNYWEEPVYIGGVWYHGPFYSRFWHGRRWFWWHGGWHVNEWHGAPGAWRSVGVRWGDHAYWRGGHWIHPEWHGHWHVRR
jgi:hypothetical protein